MPWQYIVEHRQRLLSHSYLDDFKQNQMLQYQYGLDFNILSPRSDSAWQALSLVCMSEAEDIYNGSIYQATVTRLIKLKVPQSTNMSLIELLDLPTYELKSLLVSIEQAEAERRAETDRLRMSGELPDLDLGSMGGM